MKINYVYVTVIFFLVLMLLVLFIFTNVFSFFDDYHAKCKASVFATALSPGGKSFLSDGGIDCPVRVRNFKGDAKREIANEMYHCWDNYGQGEHSLFTEKNGVFCAICTVFTIEKDQKNFNEFLYKEKYKADVFSFEKKEEEYYMNFIVSKQSEGFDPKSANFTVPKYAGDLSKNKEYIVMLYYLKGESAAAEFQRVILDEYGGRVLGAGVASAVTGAAAAIFFSGGTILIVGAAGGLVVLGLDWMVSRWTDKYGKPFGSYVLLHEFNNETIKKTCTDIEVEIRKKE